MATIHTIQERITNGLEVDQVDSDNEFVSMFDDDKSVGSDGQEDEQEGEIDKDIVVSEPQFPPTHPPTPNSILRPLGGPVLLPLVANHI